MSTKSAIVVMAILVIALMSNACAENAPINGTAGGSTDPVDVGNVTLNVTGNQTEDNVTDIPAPINSTLNGTGNETAGNGTDSDDDTGDTIVFVFAAMCGFVVVAFLILHYMTKPKKPTADDTDTPAKPAKKKKKAEAVVEKPEKDEPTPSDEKK